jgi:hypothetical protein
MRNKDQILLEKLYSEMYSESEDDDKMAEESYKRINNFLKSILPQLADAAEEVYNNWEQDEEGYSHEYGYGGICDRVADAMASKYDQLRPSDLIDWESFTMYKEYECHTDFYVVNHKIKEVIEIGLPPHAYETGGGYNWKKNEEHNILPSSFHIGGMYLDYENIFDEEGNMREF